MDIIGIAKQFLRAAGLERPTRAAFNAYVRMSPHKICMRGGITYELDLTEVIDRAIWTGGWEPETIDFLRRNIRSDDVVIEVGANVGAHTLNLAHLVGPQGKVYAFEPTVYAQTKLRVNIAHNPALEPRIVVRSELVTNRELATPIRTIRSSWRAMESQVSPEAVAAAAIALDSLELSRLDAIKIDVDGYDFKVLQGAEGIIERFHPLILIELCEYTLQAQGDSIRDIFSLLHRLGYHAAHEDGRPIRDVDEVLAIIGNRLTSINGVFR